MLSRLHGHKNMHVNKMCIGYTKHVTLILSISDKGLYLNDFNTFNFILQVYSFGC